MQGHRAVVIQPKNVEIERFDIPDLRPDEVLIQTRASLISPGTERAFYLALPNTNAAYPLIPGYSNVGDVIAIGNAVDTLKVGDRVASGAAHASHVVWPAATCVVVPEKLADEQAVFFNLIAIAMQSVHKARIDLGEPVIVIGLGPIGICAMQLARLNGALPIIAVDLSMSRLALARKAGADEAWLNDDQIQNRIRAHTGQDGATVVIEASGAAPAILAAFQMAAQRGRVILLGSARGETDHVNFYRDVHRKGLTIIGAHEINRPLYQSTPGWWTQHDEHKIALKLLALGRMSVDCLISHRFTWRDIPQAYTMLADWDDNLTGVVINWQAE